MGCSLSKAALESQLESVACSVTLQQYKDIIVDPGKLESLRLKALQDCRVLDTPAESRFDNITKLLQGIFQVPMALVSLIDEDRLVFHSIAGPAGPGGKRIHSFCDASLKADKPTMMVVEDTLLDARFQQSQFVKGPPHVRFYSGAPLVSSEGYVLGSLGVLDLVPRTFPADMLNMICNFAELVVRELERDKVVELQRLQATNLEQQNSNLVRALSCFSEAVILCDLGASLDWRVLYANEAWCELTGLSMEASLQSPVWTLLSLASSATDDSDDQLAQAQECIRELKPFSLRATLKSEEGEGASLVNGSQLALASPPGSFGAHSAPIMLDLSFRPASNDHLGEGIPLIGIPNFVELSQDGEVLEGGQSHSTHYFVVAKLWQPAHVSMMSSANRSISDFPSHRHSKYSSSGGNSMGSGSSNYSLDRPEALEDLKLGPMLGKGSFGKVYRGLWHGAQVAVKVMDTPLDALPSTQLVPANANGDSTPPTTVKGPLMEALLSRELPHPHIVQTYEYASKVEQADAGQALGPNTPEGSDGVKGDSGDEKGMAEGSQDAEGEAPKPPVMLQRMWIIQQYCNRGTLYDATDRGWLRTKRDMDGPTNMVAVLQTAQEIASAMCYLHSRDVMHGDLTGNNVLLNSSSKDERRFTALVGDFGLSRILGSNSTFETSTMGTVTHMPPEALREGRVTKALDVYSFGVLLWEMYCHRRAWCGHMPTQVVYLVATMKRKLELPQDCPSKYKELAEACMHPDAPSRPSFDEVLLTINTMMKELR